MTGGPGEPFARRRPPVLPWVALALFLLLGACAGTNVWGWLFAAVFAGGVLVAGQPRTRRRGRRW